MRRLAWTILAVLGIGMPANADDTLDWLLDQPTTQPATRPASQPAPPFAHTQNADARAGTLTLSGGKKLKGPISTTRGKPIRIFDESAKEYRDVPLNLIQSIVASVLWERDEKEWHFRESGSDIKEYSGKTYPARELQYTVTLVNGQSITGGIVAPLYVRQGDESRLLVLNKRQKGPVGQTLKELEYVKRVEFD